MKFKFYPKQSQLYDFLNFPGLVFYREEYDKLKDDHNYKMLDMKEHLEFIKGIEEKLFPYEKDIENFYMKQIFSNYNFIELIMKHNSIFEYKDKEEFLNMLLNLTEGEINSSMMYSIIMFNDEFDENFDERVKRAKKFLEKDDNIKKENLIELIKDLQIDAASKWNMFLIVQKPVKYMKKYVNLMKKLKPIFEEIYLPYKNKISEYGEYLVDFLNKEGVSALDELTYSIIDLDVIDGDEVRILISRMFPYRISIISEKDYYMIWGLEMEKAFQQMEEINENKINERVQIFKNLGDKTRYEVVKLISIGETSTKAIARILDVSSATISYHINNLLTSKVIKFDRSDNKYKYKVDYELLERAIDEFKEDLNFPE